MGAIVSYMALRGLLLTYGAIVVSYLLDYCSPIGAIVILYLLDYCSRTGESELHLAGAVSALVRADGPSVFRHARRGATFWTEGQGAAQVAR